MVCCAMCSDVGTCVIKLESRGQERVNMRIPDNVRQSRSMKPKTRGGIVFRGVSPLHYFKKPVGLGPLAPFGTYRLKAQKMQYLMMLSSIRSDVF